MLNENSDDMQPDGIGSSAIGQCPATETGDTAAIAGTCPKFGRCSAAYCPAAGGKHLQGEHVCHYLRESVKPGGQARVRASLSSALAEAVVEDGLRLLTSTGPLKKPLRRASKMGSRVESIKRAAGFRGRS